jgi:hypothetical protein
MEIAAIVVDLSTAAVSAAVYGLREFGDIG